MFEDDLEVTEDSDLKYAHLCQTFVRLQQALKAAAFSERLQKHTMANWDSEGGSSSMRNVERSFEKLHRRLRRSESSRKVLEFGDLYKELGFEDELIDALGRATLEIASETKLPRESDQYIQRRRLSHTGSERSVLSATSRSEESMHSEGYDDDFEEAESDDLEDTLDDEEGGIMPPPPGSAKKNGRAHTSSGSSKSSSSRSSSGRAKTADSGRSSHGTVPAGAEHITTRASSARERAHRPGSRKIGESEDRSWIKEDAWQLANIIGRGSFGEVYMGLTHKTGQSFAVKRLSFAGHLDELKDWYKEVQLMSGLDHVNIVKYLGAKIDEANGCLNIFQEYMPHGSLESLMKKVKGGLNIETVRNYSRQMVDGLIYLHNKKIVHRDIKGGNVLVDDGGCVKLADFGASMQIKQDNTTKSREIMGTLFFMAPEVLKGYKYGRKGDVWALGCTMIQMISGQPPWKDEIGKQGLAPAMARLLMLMDQLDGPPPYKQVQNHTKEFGDCLQYIFAKDEKDRPTAQQLRHHSFLSLGTDDSSVADYPHEGNDNSSGSIPLSRMHSDDSISAGSGEFGEESTASVAGGLSFRKLENAARIAQSQIGNLDWAPGGGIGFASDGSSLMAASDRSGYVDTFGEIEARMPKPNGNGRQHALGDADANRLPTPIATSGSFKFTAHAMASNGSMASLGSTGSEGDGNGGTVSIETEWKHPSNENPFARQAKPRVRAAVGGGSGGGASGRLGAQSEMGSPTIPKPTHDNPMRMSREEIDAMGRALPKSRYDDHNRAVDGGGNGRQSFQTYNAGMSFDDTPPDDHDTSTELLVAGKEGIDCRGVHDNDSSDADDRSDLSGEFDDDTTESGGGSWNCAKCKHSNRNDALTDFGKYCAVCGQRRDAFASRTVSDLSNASTIPS